MRRSLAVASSCLALLAGGKTSAQSCAPSPLQAFLSPQLVNGDFGTSTAASGGYAVIGCPRGDGLNLNTGTAFVYQAEFFGLTNPVPLVVPTATTGDHVGQSVAFDGDVIVLGAPNTTVGGSINAGSAHVFERNAGIWTCVATLTESAPAASRYFGQSVCVSQGRIVVGAPGDGLTSVGRAVVFQRDQFGAWVWTADLAPAVGVGGQLFGASVDCEASTITVGSPNARAAYVFDLFVGLWFQTATILDGTPQYGRAIALQGSWLASTCDAGVRVYQRSGATWALHSTLTSPLGLTDYSVSIDGNHIAAGGINASGVVAVWEMQSQTWVPLGGTMWMIAPPIPAGLGLFMQGFGASIAITGDRLVVGAPNATLSAQPGPNLQCGAAYYVRFGKGEIQTFGSSCPGTGGFAPTLATSGCAIPAGALTVTVTGGVGGSFALLLFGQSQANIPAGFGCSVHIAPVLPPTPLIPLFGTGPGQGAISFSASLPTNMPGGSFTMQAFCADPGAPLGFTATNGVEVVVH